MKHIKVYEAFQTKTELSKDTKRRYIKELGKLVSYPELFAANPDVWDVIVNEGSFSDIPEVPRGFTVHQLSQMAKDVQNKIWGTPQAAFNNFLGFVADLSGDPDEWHDFKGYTDTDYMNVFGQQDPEVIRMMRSLYEKVDVFDWIDIK